MTRTLYGMLRDVLATTQLSISESTPRAQTTAKYENQNNKCNVVQCATLPETGWHFQ